MTKSIQFYLDLLSARTYLTISCHYILLPLWYQSDLNSALSSKNYNLFSKVNTNQGKTKANYHPVRQKMRNPSLNHQKGICFHFDQRQCVNILFIASLAGNGKSGTGILEWTLQTEKLGLVWTHWIVQFTILNIYAYHCIKMIYSLE